MSPASLREQLKKKGPFDSLEQEAMLSILRTSDLLENRLARLLREYDLTPSQYNAMRIMRGEGATDALFGSCRPDDPSRSGDHSRRRSTRRTRTDRQAAIERRPTCVSGRTDRIGNAAAEETRRTDSVACTQTLLGHVSKADLKTLNGILETAREGITD